jgi:glycosyltransferase involved in cell wall biosynthesis
VTEPRIALVTPSFAPQVGGAETYISHLVAGLGTTRPVEVVAPARRGLPALAAVEGALVHRVGPVAMASAARRALAFAPAARQKLRSIRPDVVLAQYSGLMPAARYAAEARVPLVAIVHDVYGLRENLRWRGLAGALRYLGNDRLLARAHPDVVVAVSEATAAAVRKIVRCPVVVAHPGADPAPEGPDPVEGSRTVLFVGRLVPSKGPMDAARALEAVRDRVPGTRLRMVGTGPESARLPDWVEVEAPLDDPTLDLAFRTSSCLVLPSLREGWGLVLTEAVARGLPYVAYDIPAVREQHQIAGGGRLVPPGDVAGLAAAVEALVADPAARAALGARGRIASGELRWTDTVRAVRCAIDLAMDSVR